MTTYRKKPVEIEAIQWRVSNHSEVKAFLGEDYVAVLSKHTSKPAHIAISTLEGSIYAAPGDFVIRGVHGEHYPCKPDIFAETYETVGGADDSRLAELTAVAEAIARWDYITANGEEPDSDESLILPPHMEIASRVVGIIRGGA
ncbi:hypothetical protein [Leifsonia sp. P73]|uniref:hypothetical protein n=1 Tax=Leifsonia sp. P73 TaxID=3423959 RepID=UPI003DA65FAB